MEGENNNSLFTLQTNGTLKTATTFDYESNASTYTITVKAKDELNATLEGNFTVTLLDQAEINWEQDFSNVNVGQIIDLNASVSSGSAVLYTVSDTSVAEFQGVWPGWVAVMVTLPAFRPVTMYPSVGLPPKETTEESLLSKVKVVSPESELTFRVVDWPTY